MELRYPYDLNNTPIFDREDPIIKKKEQLLLAWFTQRGIEYARTAPPTLLEGWLGHYYIDARLESPEIMEFMREFEDEQGVSTEPDKFQLLFIDYNIWVDHGGLQDHLNYLATLSDVEPQQS